MRIQLFNQWEEFVEFVKLSGRPRFDVFYWPREYSSNGFRDLIIVDDDGTEIR